jgi:rhamnosyltransferase
MPSSYFLRKFFEIFYDVFFMVRLARKNDILYILGMTAGWAVFIPKLCNQRLKIFVNIDGVEWKRDKFSLLEKSFLRFNTALALLFTDKIILDALRMENHIGRRWKSKEIFIPYGVTLPEPVPWHTGTLTALAERCPEMGKIEDNSYWLIVARLEPENNIHMILEGFIRSRTPKPLVVVGNFSSPKYRVQIENLIRHGANKKIILVGGIYNDNLSLNMLRQHAFGYFHGHSVGGTNPSLLDAMAMKNIIFAHDNEFNREVCDNFALYFGNPDELSRTIDQVEDDPSAFLALKDQVYARVNDHYSWNKIVGEYEMNFEGSL